MATSRSEDSDVNKASTSRQKRGISFTGMLRDSLSLLVPTFVLDATTPKRRRVQEDTQQNVRSTEENTNQQLTQSGFNCNSNLQACTSTPTGIDSIINRQSVLPAITPLYPTLSSYRENTSGSERASSPDNSLNRPPSTSAAPVLPQPITSHLTPTQNIPREFTNAAKRTRLNDSHVPSSFSAWAHTSGSSSSGSQMGETYHQSPFYPGKTSYGGASNYRRETLRNRLNNKRSQTTVVPLRLNSVISQRYSVDNQVTDHVSDFTSTSSDDGPILSAATRRILRAMRRGTDGSQDTGVGDIFGTTARSIRNQRHLLWNSCVRRRGRSALSSNAPPTNELRRIPQSTLEANNVLSSTSWPRGAIGLPPVGSSSSSNHQLDSRLHSNDLGNVSSELQRAIGVLAASYSFSSPAVRSQPTTRPPSNASSCDNSRSNFVFQSPPSRSASSNALTELVSSSKSQTSPSSVENIFSSDVSNSKSTTDTTSISNFSNIKSSLKSNTSSTPNSPFIPTLFSESRTLPEIRPTFDALPVSLSANQVSPVTSQRALPQESWRCEACLAENNFLVTSCRVCQRGPSVTVAASQRLWHSESDKTSSHTHDHQNSSKKDSHSNALQQKDSTISIGAKSSLTQVKSSKWRCETCLVENLENVETCVCCQSRKTKPKPLLAPSLQTPSGNKKWRCETCMVENSDSDETCVCCSAAKPKATKSNTVANIPKTNTKWQCDTCLVENDDSKQKCVCCESLKPKSGAKDSGVSKAPTTVNSDSWRCDTCLVENKSTVTKCVCCETPKAATSTGQDKGNSVIKDGGLLASWKGSGAAKFNFGTGGNSKEKDVSVAENSTGFKFGSFGSQKVNNNANVEITESKVKFGSVGSVSSCETPFGNPTIAFEDKKSTEISNIKFGQSSSDVSFKFGNSADQNKEKSGGFVFGKSSSSNDFMFGAPKDKSEKDIPKLPSMNFGSGNNTKVGFSFGTESTRSSEIGLKNDSKTSFDEVNIPKSVKSNPVSMVNNSSSEKKPGFSFGGFNDVKQTESAALESNSDKENPVKQTFNPPKGLFGDGMSTSIGSGGCFSQPSITTSLANHKPSFMETPKSTVPSLTAPVSHFDKKKMEPQLVSDSSTKVNAPGSMLPNVFGQTPSLGQTSVAGNSVTANPASTSIESLFSSSAPKMAFGKQNTVPIIPQFGASIGGNDKKVPEISIFGSNDPSKQKKLTASMSSPTLSSLPTGSSSNPTIKSNPPSFLFGSSGSSGESKFPSTGVMGNDNNKQTTKTFNFGGSSNDKPSTFPTPTLGPNPKSTNPPPTIFGNVNQNSTGGFLSNGPSSNNTSMFPTSQLSFGNSQQPFVFGGSASSGSNQMNASAPAGSAAPAPTIPSSFQFGGQASGQQPLFLFGNNPNPPTNSMGSTNSFGSTTPAMANPFSSNQGPVVASNPNRPIKKAVRRLRK